MDAKTAIQIALDTGKRISDLYLADLTDEEMLHRPAEGCNHVKWQLGHLILSEHQMIGGCFPGQMPELPTGFSERYSKQNCRCDQPERFDSKARLLELQAQQRSATLRLLQQISAEELDRPAPESIRGYAPTVGSAFVMQEVHWTMHAGQWAVVRRQLGRPAVL